MAFTAEQRQALAAKLDGRAVRERDQHGQAVSYLEGWAFQRPIGSLASTAGTGRP